VGGGFMEELHGVYVSTVEAANMMSRNEDFITHLCQRGKLVGVKKVGKSWLIPIESIKSYTPGRRGPRTKKERLSGELAGIRAEMTNSKEE
jgi:hypothetical protein